MTNYEARTVEAMIHIYCRANHDTKRDLCEHCAGLLAYANERIEKCPYGYDKPVCNKCKVHCYSPEMRGRIQCVMRFAGPRIIRSHPLLAIRHMVRSRKNVER